MLPLNGIQRQECQNPDFVLESLQSPPKSKNRNQVVVKLQKVNGEGRENLQQTKSN